MRKRETPAAPVTIWIPGTPRAQPRPRFDRKTGTTYTPGKHVGPWKTAIRKAASEAGVAGALFDVEPVAVRLTFLFERPKYHRRADGSLTPRAPRWHTQKPDVDNLAKAALDALSPSEGRPAVAWWDDAQVMRLEVSKQWEDDPTRSGGLLIRLDPINLGGIF